MKREREEYVYVPFYVYYLIIVIVITYRGGDGNEGEAPNDINCKRFCALIKDTRITFTLIACNLG